MNATAGTSTVGTNGVIVRTKALHADHFDYSWLLLALLALALIARGTARGILEQRLKLKKGIAMKRNDIHTATMAMPTSGRRDHETEAGANTRPVEVELAVAAFGPSLKLRWLFQLPPGNCK
jgi:hypothetical protein